MSLVRLFKSFHSETGAPENAPGAAALTASLMEPLILQLEDDMRFTMRMIGHEAEKAKSRLDENAEQVERIRAAGESLEALSDSASEIFAALGRSSERLAGATVATRADVANAALLGTEARQLTAEVGGNLKRLNNAVDRIDTAARDIVALSRHSNILSLNAGIAAARASAACSGCGSSVDQLRSLSENADKCAQNVAAQVGALRELARQNDATLGRIDRLMRRVEPLMGSIQDALRVQNQDIETTATRAADSARFVRAVAGRAGELTRLAEIAGAAGKQAKKAGDDVVAAMGRHGRRSTAFVRSTAWGNRRELRRAPVKIPARILFGGVEYAATALDVSLGGALITSTGSGPLVGEKFKLTLESVGDCPCVAVGVSDIGRHVKFENPSVPFIDAIRRLMESSLRGDAPFIAAVRTAAAETSRVFSEALARGEVRLDDLITTNYRPIPGTESVQYETDALPFYIKALPPILRALWDASPAPAYAVASDRNAYLPVHHPNLSQAPRPSDFEWNDANCRDKRILDSWEVLIVSRNEEPFFEKVMFRKMKDGSIIPIKNFSAPVRVAGRLWGNIHLGYFF